MISIRREFFIFLTIIVAILTKYECRGQTEESRHTVDYSVPNKLVSTYRSKTEKLIQGFLGVVSDDSSSTSTTSTLSTSESSTESENTDETTRWIEKIVPKFVKDAINPLHNKTAKTFGEVLNLVKAPFHSIFPGTLWCGGGDIADSEGNEVGLFEKADACCRAHDMCPTIIEAGESSESLLNDATFTRLICDCDHAFYSCLRKVDSTLSKNIGATYFNILRPQCFDLKHPIKACEEYGGGRLAEPKCLKYQFDESQPKRMTWLDNPDF